MTISVYTCDGNIREFPEEKYSARAQDGVLTIFNKETQAVEFMAGGDWVVRTVLRLNS